MGSLLNPWRQVSGLISARYRFSSIGFGKAPTRRYSPSPPRITTFAKTGFSECRAVGPGHIPSSNPDHSSQQMDVLSTTFTTLHYEAHKELTAAVFQCSRSDFNSLDDLDKYNQLDYHRVQWLVGKKVDNIFNYGILLHLWVQNPCMLFIN